MHPLNEEKLLAHTIILDLENDKKNMHMICMQASRLALLLNNTKKSIFFSKSAREISEVEAFLNSYGLITQDLIQKIDPGDLYEFNDLSKLLPFSYKYLDDLNAFDYTSEKRSPINDIRKYWNYKEKYADTQSEIYEYAMNALYQLEFTENVLNIFSEYEKNVNNSLPERLPDSKEKLDSISKNLQSQNIEDWSNAVHLCRKLLQDFADAMYPPSNEPLIDEKGIKHSIGPKEYKNRLKNYVFDHSDSKRFIQITNSNIQYISDRIDAIFEASNKGSHTRITSLEEAKRYVIHTYLIIGDIISL